MSGLITDLLYASDPAVFSEELLGIHPDPWQARVLRWTGKRLLMNCARQTGKSTVAAILALHRTLYFPHRLILLVSPSLRQSSELFRKVVDFLDNLEQKPVLLEDNKLSLQMQNRSRIASLPSSEATVRGFSGVDLIIEDEAARVADDLYVAIRPMLATSGGQLILMSTPCGKRGHFWQEWTNGGEDWERVEARATECPRITPGFLAGELRSLCDRWYRQEYLCEFVDAQDQIFRYEDIVNAVSSDVKPIFI